MLSSIIFCFCLMKIFRNHYKLTFAFFVINDVTIILIFQLNEYNQQSNAFFVNEIIDVNRHDFNLVVINRLRSTIVKSIVRNTRQIFVDLLDYFIEWNINKTALRRFIQRFNRDITDYKAFFITIKNRLFNNSDENSLFELFVSKNQKFHSIFSKNLRSLIFSSFTSQSKNSSSSFFCCHETRRLLIFSFFEFFL